MAISLIDVRIKDYVLSGKEWRVNYSVTPKTADSVFLVQHRRLPFLRLASDRATVEIWLGVPPRTDVELNRDINGLVLPETLELAPGAVLNTTAVVKRPLKESGYWLEEREEIAIPLGNMAAMKALVVQGFGLSPLDPRRVCSIDQLYGWQLTSRSQVITLELPPDVP